MENKQLDNKYLLMNKKEELIWKVNEERYHEREEYGHRERGRYGRY